YWLETHKAVFRWVLNLLDEEGLVSGRTVSIDATTLEANAALKSIVRRDNGQSYNDYLKELAQAAGMENPTREQLARLDRERQTKGAHHEGPGPGVAEGRLNAMKDRRPVPGDRAEHAGALASGAPFGVTLAPGEGGGSPEIHKTLQEAQVGAREIN